MLKCHYRELYWRGRLISDDLLVKMACFVKKKEKRSLKQLIWTSKCKGVNHTDPSPSVRIPWSLAKSLAIVTMTLLSCVLLASQHKWKTTRLLLQCPKRTKAKYINCHSFWHICQLHNFDLFLKADFDLQFQWPMLVSDLISCL